MNDFDPNGVGLNNGHFIGLPFSEDEAKVVVLSVPWDVTVSYVEGTAHAPQRILEASTQLDLYDPDLPDVWKMGIFVRPNDPALLASRNTLRPKVNSYIGFVENGGDVTASEEMTALQNEINLASAEVNHLVYFAAKELIENGKVPAVLGGEHSCPLGLLKALSEKQGPIAVLQVDAHQDLRKAYEGFKYSHASVFYNAIEEGYVNQLVQVGIRDNCEEEVAYGESKDVKVFYDAEMKAASYQGKTWQQQVQEIISGLPKQVYISFDIDGLSPHLCPGTGTPVPGGLEFQEAMYLIVELVRSGRKIIGFDLSEVGTSEWDASVGARVLYKLCNWAGRSQGWI